MSKPIRGASSKTPPHAMLFQASSIVIFRVYQDCYLKCDVDIFAIKSRLISQHLPISSTIPLKNISFKFDLMNNNPFDTTFVCTLQNHSLGIKLYILHCYPITLLSICSKFLKLENGLITFNEALLNLSILTTY